MLKNQTAVITGSARGIGADIARALAEWGANIVISDLKEDDVRMRTEEIRAEFGVQTQGIVCDVRKKDEVQNLARQVQERFKSLDIWVNNAGISRDNILLRMSEEDWDEVFAVNLKGAFLGVQAAARYMIKARKGKIINIGSVSGFYGNFGQGNYSASKAALATLTKSAARELAARNININCVASGFISNDFTEDLPADIHQKILDQIPLNRPPEKRSMDVARAVRFLASPEAEFITGSILRVDGGMMIGF